MKRAASVAAAVSALILAASTQASASSNSGWVYTTNKGGKAYFVADVKGQPGKEQIKVCDLKTNNRAVRISFFDYGLSDGSGAGGPVYKFTDDTNDGKCVVKTHNWFAEESDIEIYVEETHNGKTYNLETIHAVS